MPGILLLALMLPLFRFGNSLWSDEATSVYFGRWPLADLWQRLCDPHPAGYYALLKAWMMAGEQEWWLRWPSLAAAVLSTALIYRLGREMGLRERTATFAALLLALHPLQLWYAAEARMYTLAGTVALAAVLLGWRLIRLPDNAQNARRRLLLGLSYTALALLALGVDYTAILPLFALQMIWLAAGAPHRRNWIAWQLLVGAGSLLLWFDAAHRSAVATSFQAFTLAVQLNRLGLQISPAQANDVIQTVMLVLAVSGLAIAWSWQRFPRLRSWRLVWWTVLAVWLGWMAFMAVPRMVSLKRQWVALLPLMALASAYALQRLPRILPALVLALSVALAVVILPMPQRESWRLVLTDLVEHSPDAPLWVDEWAVTSVTYYDRQLRTATGQGLLWAPLLSSQLPRLPQLQPAPGGELWLIVTDGPYRHFLELMPTEFFARYEFLDRSDAGGVTLLHYRRRLHALSPPPDPPLPSRETLWSLESAFPLDVCP